MKWWNWVKEKWKLVLGLTVGFVVSLFTFFNLMLRSRKQKGVLEEANKAHEAENKANDSARKDLVNGLSDISKEKDSAIVASNKEIDEAEKGLAEDKKAFVDEASGSNDLGLKIADRLG